MFTYVDATSQGHDDSTVGESGASGVSLWRPAGTQGGGQATRRPGRASYTMRRSFGFILEHLVDLQRTVPEDSYFLKLAIQSPTPDTGVQR